MTLYTDDFGIDVMAAPRGIKGENWLTFVSNTLIERLCGPEALQVNCRRFAVEPAALANGFMKRRWQVIRISYKSL